MDVLVRFGIVAGITRVPFKARCRLLQIGGSDVGVWFQCVGFIICSEDRLPVRRFWKAKPLEISAALHLK
jgi:hypothetical protein